MVRTLLMLALIVGVLGCGKAEETAELKRYVSDIRKFDSWNARVEATILRFDDPTQEINNSDIEAARNLLDEYEAVVAAVEQPEDRTLRNTHGVYVRAFEEARTLARDETGDTKRQSHSVAIGLRKLRRDIEDRVYPTLEVLLSRYKLAGDEFIFAWPG
jgi:hypothetical protein